MVISWLKDTNPLPQIPQFTERHMKEDDRGHLV